MSYVSERCKSIISTRNKLVRFFILWFKKAKRILSQVSYFLEILKFIQINLQLSITILHVSELLKEKKCIFSHKRCKDFM